MQTKAPKHQPVDDSGDDSNSSIGSDSSIMSIEAVPRAHIWRNDTSSSKRDRKVSHLRNVSTIHSVRMSRRLSEKRDNAKPDVKPSSKLEATVPPAAAPAEQQTAPLSSATLLVQPTPATQPCRTQRSANTAETMHRSEEDYYRYNQEESRPRFENEYKSTSHLNPRGAEFESIRLAIRINEWYRDRVPDEELTELPAQ